MNRRFFLVSGIAGLAVAAGGYLAVLSLPETEASTASPIDADEHARTIAALAPPKRSRPLVAVVAGSRGGETTDFLVPFGVLSRSQVADVRALAVREGPLPLMPALAIRPHTTLAAFDAEQPDGTDFVVVPAMHEQDPEIIAWLRKQAVTGATIIGVCEGARLVAAAGLLDGRRATTHWHAIEGVQRASPTMTWERDRRYVVDRGVVTTTGVTASLPVSLALVEAIAGAERARTLARELGIETYDARHDSAAFRLTARHMATAARNWLAFWTHQTLGLQVADGVDEIALAFTADAFSRTYRSRARTVASVPTVRSLSGLEIVVDHTTRDQVDDMLSPLVGAEPGRALERALAQIAARYGESTSAFVALQLEYPWRMSRQKT
jgi:transcriptional regulator GlxA family with amidase domain